MRISRLLLAIPILAVTLAVAPVAQASATTPRLKIEPKTSKIMMVDISPAGTGYFVPGVLVRAKFRHCPPAPPGTVDQQTVTLTQDGVSYGSVNTSLGGDEVTCPADGKPFVVEALMGGEGLHPGRAQVTYSIAEEQGTVVASDARTVTIPKGKGS